MAETASVADFVAALRRCDLADAAAWEAVARTTAGAEGLARALVRAGALTPFQARRLLRNRGDELVVGPFVLLDRLGSGGMGQVYKARHRLMGRLVALKFVRPEHLARPDAVARFLQEVQAAARLSHPNIVQAYHAEKTARGFFLAMEFCDGRDLAKAVADGGPLPVPLARDYAAQVAAGLSAAHAAGLVHRDVKPSNLLLTADGRVKILDFGLARFHADGGAGRLTRDGAVMGTPDFMAPEQARDSAAADIRADVYSLGCTLYFLLAGRVPFPGGSDWEKVMKHATGTPVPVEVLRPDVPAGLAAVLRKMTAREPADRYQAPAEVEAALAPFRAPDLAPAVETLAPAATGFAPPFVPPDRSIPTAPYEPTPSAPFEVAEPEPAEPLSLADDAPARRTRSRAGLRAALAAVCLAAVAVAAVAWPDGRPRSQPESERKPDPSPARKPDPGTPGADPKTGGAVAAKVEIVTPQGESPLEGSVGFRAAFRPAENGKPDPRQLAVARGAYTRHEDRPGGVEVSDLDTGRRRVLYVSDAKPAVFAVAFSDDGRFLAAGCGMLDAAFDGAEVAVFETTGWTRVAHFRTDFAGVFSLAFQPRNPRCLVVGGKTNARSENGGGLDVWDGGNDWAGKPDRVAEKRDLPAAVNGVAFESGKFGSFVTAVGDGTVRTWVFGPGKQLQAGMVLPEQAARGAVPGPFLDLALSRDGRWVVTGTCAAPGDPPGAARRLAVWDLDARMPALTTAAAPDDSDLISFAFLPDGTGVATADKKGNVRVWDVPGLKPRGPAAKPFPKGNVWGLAAAPDGKHLAAVGWDGEWVSRVALIPVAGAAGK